VELFVKALGDIEKARDKEKFILARVAAHADKKGLEDFWRDHFS
jgi:hypothetical protein